MYVIIVYDVEQKRVTKVCQYLRRFLHWVQNSAFEGELTEAQLHEIKFGLMDIIDPQVDSVYIYHCAFPRMVRKEVIGVEKSMTDIFIE